MRILFYFNDCNKSSDYKEGNPYFDYIQSLSDNYTKVSRINNYHSSYHSTSKWLWSVLEMTENLHTSNYDYMKNPNLEESTNNYRLINRLQSAGYLVRTTEAHLSTTDQDYRYTNQEVPMMLTGLGVNVIREDLFSCNLANVCDFVYDYNVHEFLNTLVDKDDSKEAYNQAFEGSKSILNKKFFSKYDIVIYISDHGYSRIGDDGTYIDNFVQHNGFKSRIALGSPEHHSKPILYLIYKKFFSSNLNNKNLVTQVDVADMIVDLTSGSYELNLGKYKPYIILHGYESFRSAYPDVYHIAYEDGSYKSFDMTAYFMNGVVNSDMYRELPNIGSNWITGKTPSLDDLKLLHSESHYFHKQVDLSTLIKRYNESF